MSKTGGRLIKHLRYYWLLLLAGSKTGGWVYTQPYLGVSFMKVTVFSADNGKELTQNINKWLGEHPNFEIVKTEMAGTGYGTGVGHGNGLCFIAIWYTSISDQAIS
jgi:hypothetical protein